MNAPYISVNSRRLSRRACLRGAGVSIALPWLEAMFPAFSHAVPRVPKRMILISNNLGVLPKPFFPGEKGPDYRLSPYLESLAAHRGDFTVVSGLSHPGVTGEHSTENCFLTAARGPTRSGFRNSISLDQFAAEKLGQSTRFSTLNLGVNIDKANRSLSWTRDGVLLPAEDSAAALFRQMFVQGDAAAVERQMRRLEERGSILDTLGEETKRLSLKLGGDDRSRMDQYLTSVRELEERLVTAQEWERRPRPVAPVPEPVDIADKKLFFQKLELMLSMASLAIESDSTRIVTLMVDAFATPAFRVKDSESTTDGYHNLSHHGQAAEKVRQLEEADRRQMDLLNGLLSRLASRTEGDARLLDRTMVLYGSNMGDANTHDNRNLPILLAGGKFRHGAHLAFDRENNTPLSRLFVSMLQEMEVEAGSFGGETGTLTGLERKAVA
ncbi:MAG: DUF1552 domain-containing protein [Verrucomicrobiae bacterium]|nr:DUF1552 domain-containing protein [Verrucomicrobiae bacterium]